MVRFKDVNKIGYSKTAITEVITYHKPPTLPRIVYILT